MQELKPLLEAFRFEIEPFNLSSFKKEFKFLLGNNPGEVRAEHTEDDLIIRFDLVRQLFLERGL